MKKQTAMRQLLNQLREERNTLPMDAEWNRCFQAIESVIESKYIDIEKEQIVKNIVDYNVKVTEFLLTPLFNLEHSKHGISCEKLAIIRNQFINELLYYNETYNK